MALLLAQAGGAQDCRDLLGLQLADWSRMQTDCFLPEERLRIFTLLSGKLVRTPPSTVGQSNPSGGGLYGSTTSCSDRRERNFKLLFYIMK